MKINENEILAQYMKSEGIIDTVPATWQEFKNEITLMHDLVKVGGVYHQIHFSNLRLLEAAKMERASWPTPGYFCPECKQETIKTSTEDHSRLLECLNCEYEGKG